jgi:tRNA pseudouridine38-40 synthase
VLKLTLEYDGGAFVGWQVQPNGPSVQAAVEAAAARLCGEPVRVTGAGRTDAGVHARGQVASLQPPRELPLKAWTAGLNGLLPPEVACVRAEVAPEGFDARRWARGKRYVYSILQSPTRAPRGRSAGRSTSRRCAPRRRSSSAPTTSLRCARPTARRRPPCGRCAGSTSP